MGAQRKAEATDRTNLRASIERLGPYQSLILLLVPASIVEPLKLAAVAIAGDGHWITGSVVIVAAYAASLLVVERLFRIVKPKLLMLPWFARIWSCFAVLCGRVFHRSKIAAATGARFRRREPKLNDELN
ncbi:hypothetical protein IVB27_14545 [Bradyrhizobium sp. 197]|uniref:hypothetical protein n=1 Tax=Bradyrhizobium sp. 197 TaxID=2782663 RepID=UPI001FF81A75|nr:hypothetical protein [Bradyrhizobium sp. 197]MCK1475995.1 hypothetical protein [Bradyrhizobium sp. 197]